MLQSMRDKAKSWGTIIIVTIIVFMMAITGLETLTPNTSNPVVATVNGQDISQADLQRGLEQQRRLLIQQMGDQFDPSTIDDTVFRKAVLQSLIERTLQLQDADKQGMTIGEQALDHIIVNMPEFQQNGQFDQSRFQMLVRNAGMTPLQLKQVLTEENLLLQLRSGLAASGFTTDNEIKHLNTLENQKRTIAWITLKSAPVKAAITPSDEDITTYYQANQDDFMTPETVVVDYVTLDKQALASHIQIDEAAINNEYQLRLDRLKAAPAQPTVATILIATGNKRDLAAAQQRANTVLAKLQAGADFAALAKTYSDDPKTAARGGDIGVVQPGVWGAAFDNAIATLPVGEIAGPITTDQGLHLVKVTKREQPPLPRLATLRDDIARTLKAALLEKQFLEKTRQLADISFEAADLTQPAEQLGLTIQTSATFGRRGGDGIAAHPKVITAAFSEEVLTLGANSDVIELSPQQAIVLKVKSHQPPQLMALDTVKSTIITALKRQQAQQQLQTQAEQLVDRFQASTELNTAAKAAGLRWTERQTVTREQAGVPRQLLHKAFTLPLLAEGKASVAATTLTNDDVAVIALHAIHPGKHRATDNKRLAGLAQYMASSDGRRFYNEYLRYLKAQAAIKINRNSETQ